MTRTSRWLWWKGFVVVSLAVCTLGMGCAKSPPGLSDAGASASLDGGRIGDAGTDAGVTARGASVTVTVSVPGPLTQPPFDQPRTLVVPKGFAVEVLARVPGARFLLSLPDGDLLVSQPGAGKVSRVHEATAGVTVSNFLTGLTLPQDLVLHAVGATTYLYVGEEDGVTRYDFDLAGSAVSNATKVVSGLPTGGNHRYKDIAVGPDHALYVDLGSSCNVCTEDFALTPQRAAIYAYDGDGKNRRLVSTGIRNGEGLAFEPGTSNLWVVVNNRDQIPYPFHDDGGIPYGSVDAGYVDNHPPEEFAHVQSGANFGWPYCNPNPDTATGFGQMPFTPDTVYQHYPDGGEVDCNVMTRIDRGMQAHSAPLGLTFGQGTAVTAPYADGAFVGFHGSWNRTKFTGYKVAWFPWNSASGTPDDAIDFARGWATDNDFWGRPVDVAIDAQGRVLVSDDWSGTLYRMTYTAAP